jgi:hypothetical protein
MAVIPSKRSEQVTFCESHLPVWNAAPPAAIGLTAPQIAALNAKTVAARQALSALAAARQASKAATLAFYTACAAMRDEAADLVKFIKAYAESQPNPLEVYVLAEIDPPAPPTPLPAPGKPKDFLVALENSGAITLSWAADNAAASSGAFYTVRRKLPGQSKFMVLGGTGGSTLENRRMFFTDATIPASAAGEGVVYEVQGQRGTTMGTPSDAITVQFGTDGTGRAVARIAGAAESGSQPRLAA